MILFQAVLNYFHVGASKNIFSLLVNFLFNAALSSSILEFSFVTCNVFQNKKAFQY